MSNIHERNEIVFTIIFENEFAQILENNLTKEKRLIALKPFKVGDSIESFFAKDIYLNPNYLTIQISDDEHILLKPIFLQYINHSCEPNSFFDTTKMELFCIKPISIGEEFNFFYPSSEWKMNQKFACNCGKINCIGTIQGAYYLNEENIHTYQFTDYILGKLNKK